MQVHGGEAGNSNHLSAHFQLECPFWNVAAKIRQRILGKAQAAPHILRMDFPSSLERPELPQQGGLISH